jgi:hypothetical protein
MNNKHIPDVYKINDRQTRLELLAGIIDTDGSYCDDSKGYDIIQKNKVLADDILFVARSLGFSANMSQCEKYCMYKSEKRTGTYHRIHLSGDNLSCIPVKCPRKMAKNDRVINKDSMVMGITIEPRGWGKYYGFELDKNHKYLLGDFTITHNTSLVKEGISKILNREFAFVPLGGATDSSYLEGHSYTYEGSTWGKIVDILIHSKSMNPIIYFDELDKISETPKGEEIIGILTHLTDTTQNSQFHDKYFAEIDFDLSKCLFIFSYNDPLKVNPILLDRMYKIKTSGYQVKDKIVIAQQYLIPIFSVNCKILSSLHIVKHTLSRSLTIDSIPNLSNNTIDNFSNISTKLSVSSFETNCIVNSFLIVVGNTPYLPYIPPNNSLIKKVGQSLSNKNSGSCIFSYNLRLSITPDIYLPNSISILLQFRIVGVLLVKNLISSEIA